MRILAIDPGGTTGYAVLEDGKPTHMGQIDSSDILRWINSLTKPDVLILENYRVRPGHKRWDETQPSQLIGAFKLKAAEWGIEPVMQEPAIKPVGYGWMRAKFGITDKNHMLDALAHSIYYYYKNRTDEIVE